MEKKALTDGHRRLQEWSDTRKSRTAAAADLDIGHDWLQVMLLYGAMPSTALMERIYRITGTSPNDFFDIAPTDQTSEPQSPTSSIQ